MPRRASPLLHDYKSRPAPRRQKHEPFRWFVAGLGVPLLLTAIFVGLSDDDDAPAVEPVAVVASPPAPEQPLTLAPSGETDASLSSATPGVVEQTADMEAVVFTKTDSEEATKDAFRAFHPPLINPAEQADLITVTIKRGDTMDRVFRRNGLDVGDLTQIASLPEAGDYLRKLRPGDEVAISHIDGNVVRLYRDLELTSALDVTRVADGFVARLIDRPVEVRREIAYGRIENSLFESAATAGLSDSLIMNLAGIFAWDVDFVLDIRTDDNYYIIYEELWQDGEYVGDGEIVAAEFNNDGRSYQAVRFVDKTGSSDYFTPEGASVRKAFVRAPVDFSRISSGFNPRRRHPILNTIRAHRGVDYAAPRGTPVKAAGDGKVIFRGVKGGYGNTVILQHGGNITTLYAHLNAFDRKAGISKRVKQGQTIGYVGATGLATAPHLHYEYRLNGVHRNPRTVELPQAAPIKSEYMQEFLAASAPILEELQQFKQTRVASISTD